ncbi:GNAT family N-acetyltransferase [Wukongibacter baidiensis]|uniref:GNAT family N-acetyltransferase n=1 Tax=Wukongibacter baidiensis TaxID=1723361 RepID=UPI003D7FDFDA
MIYELSKDRYYSIHSLLDNTMDNIEIKAVIDGINPGWIFVDRVESPRNAMIWSRGIQGFYFVGESNNTQFNNYINDFIDKEIEPRAIKEGLNRFEFSGETGKWDPVLEEMFKNRELSKSRQYIYKLESAVWDFDDRRKLDEGFILREFNEEMFNDPNIKNLEFLSSEIERWWDSYEDYLEKSFGYCIIAEDKVVNYCLCNFVHEDTHTMGIETQKDFRRKGLSQATTEAFVENCIRNNLKPYWECMESNLASRSLAEKLGFTRTHIYSLYSFPFK